MQFSYKVGRFPERQKERLNIHVKLAVELEQTHHRVREKKLMTKLEVWSILT
jgi:hypothetical protein